MRDRRRSYLRISASLILGCCLLRPAVATGQPSQARAVVSLVSEEPTLKPGAPAWVGVLFELEPEWHIYWVNPGDAGDPPRLRWELPPGFRANDIRWPVPVRLVLGPVVDYGYEGRVLLALPIDVPADYEAGTPVTLAADVRYVICRDVCIPARTRVALSVGGPNASATAGTAARELFKATRARWPKPVPAGWRASAVASGPQLALSLRTGKSESVATFFPLEPDQIDNAVVPRAQPTADGVRILLQRADPEGPVPATLRGVVVLGDQAFEVAADVK